MAGGRRWGPPARAGRAGPGQFPALAGRAAGRLEFFLTRNPPGFSLTGAASPSRRTCLFKPEEEYLMEKSPKLTLHKETLRVLTDPKAVVRDSKTGPPDTRGYCTATCVTCYGTCTC